MNISIETAVEGFVAHVYSEGTPKIEASHIFTNVADLTAFVTTTLTPAPEAPAAAPEATE